MSCSTTEECKNQIIESQLKKDPLTPEDVKHNAQLSSALAKSGMPIHKMTSMVSALHEKIMCDEACQEQRKKKKIKTKDE